MTITFEIFLSIILFLSNRLNKLFALQNFCCRNDNRWRCCVIVFVEISIITWSKVFCELLLISKRRHSRERFSRIELLQNTCFQKSVSSMIENLIVSTFILFFVWNFVNSLTWNQEIKFIKIFCVCITIHFVSMFTFAHFSISKKWEKIFCFCVCTLWEKTSLKNRYYDL